MVFLVVALCISLAIVISGYQSGLFQQNGRTHGCGPAEGRTLCLGVFGSSLLVPANSGPSCFCSSRLGVTILACYILSHVIFPTFSFGRVRFARHNTPSPSVSQRIAPLPPHFLFHLSSVQVWPSQHFHLIAASTIRSCHVTIRSSFLSVRSARHNILGPSHSQLTSHLSIHILACHAHNLLSPPRHTVTNLSHPDRDFET